MTSPLNFSPPQNHGATTEQVPGDERLRGAGAAGSKEGGVDSSSGKDGILLDQASGGDVGGGEGVEVTKPPEVSSVDIRIAMIGNVDR